MPWFINDVNEPLRYLIFNIKSANYQCIISEISKSEPINLLQNIDLTEKRRTLENPKVYYYK